MTKFLALFFYNLEIEPSHEKFRVCHRSNIVKYFDEFYPFSRPSALYSCYHCLRADSQNCKEVRLNPRLLYTSKNFLAIRHFMC
jgi:hypothetical protein